MKEKEFEETIKKKNAEIDQMLVDSYEGVQTIGEFLRLKDKIDGNLFNRVNQMLVEANRGQILRTLVALENLESFVKEHCPNEKGKAHWLQFLKQMSGRLMEKSELGKETILKMKELENKIAS